MQETDSIILKQLQDWCATALGPCEITAGELRFHGRSTVMPLSTLFGECYLKVYREPSAWESELHGYEQWARAFGAHAPRLLAVRDELPLAIITSALDGVPMAQAALSSEQEHAVWRQAGAALAGLHALPAGPHFGPCRRDGSPVGAAVTDAGEYVLAELGRWTNQGLQAGRLSGEQVALIQRAQRLSSAFEGERPTPCHRDYGPANWLVNADGTWAGVIDFEFAYADVRVADFTRYPDWEWLLRPSLIDAFFEGYGRPLADREELQCLLGHVQYAVTAIVWGQEHGFLGFAKEGCEALSHLAAQLV